jgi:hypothetical protein
MPASRRSLLLATISLVCFSLSVPAPVFSRTSAAAAQAETGKPKFTKWITVMPDEIQYMDSSVPVVIFRTKTSPDPEYRDRAGIKAAGLENRSRKGVRSVRLRWVALLNKNRIPGLREWLGHGQLESMELAIEPGKKLKIEISAPKLSEMIKHWMEENPNDQQIAFYIGVSEVVFEDGSMWRDDVIDS